ncbi:MAG: hypothetical protein MGG11_10590 [Trichodesmium sp. MAG_R03]|nr:hypothetical protein [Trichodesmium sp. MAG_R04]MCL2932679.1 hypothetical protein [Trichodesmium sp. MAG_R03]
MLKLSEKKPVKKEKESDSSHRKPGGQPGNPGNTGIGFDRVDPYQVVEPQRYPVSGGNHWKSGGATTRSYQVAQLVEHPIEIVEYRQVQRFCSQCGEQVSGELSELVIPGQDLSANLQAMPIWLGHYGHLSYEK